jgi:tetratricopeptide (TPR) repeat protein
MRGDLDGAADVLGRAVATSVSRGDRRVELRARIELANVRTLRDPDEAAAELLELATNAIPIFERSRDDRALGRAWLLLSIVKGALRYDNATWEAAALRAADYYRRAGWSPSTCLDGVASALYYGPRPVQEALNRCDELLKESGGDPASEANVLVWMGGLAAMHGLFDQGRSLVEQARNRYEELGQTLGAAATCGLVLGEIEMLAGYPDAAEQALRESCDTCERLHETFLLAARAAQLADSLYLQGRYDEAQGWIRKSRENAAEEDIDAQSYWRAVEAKLEARRSEFDTADRLAREAVQRVEHTDALNHRAKVLLDLAEVLALSGRWGESVEVAKGALDLYVRKGNTAAADRTRSLLTTSSAV